MAATRIRKVGTQKEFDSIVDDYITQGYGIMSRGEKTALLRKNSWGTGAGHIFAAVLTIWWTLGIGNLIYAVASHFMAEKVLVRIGDEATG
jgi:hypothetical protein